MEVITKPYLHSGYISGNGVMPDNQQRTPINFITVIVTAFIIVVGSVIAAVLYKFLKKVNKAVYITLSAIVILILALGTFFITDYFLNKLTTLAPTDTLPKERNVKIYDRDGEEIYKIDATETNK